MSRKNERLSDSQATFPNDSPDYDERLSSDFPKR